MPPLTLQEVIDRINRIEASREKEAKEVGSRKAPTHLESSVARLARRFGQVNIGQASVGVSAVARI